MSVWLLPIGSTNINSCSNQEDVQSEQLKGAMWRRVGLILLLNNLTPSLTHPLGSTRMEAHGEFKPSQFQTSIFKLFFGGNLLKRSKIALEPHTFRLGTTHAFNWATKSCPLHPPQSAEVLLWPGHQSADFLFWEFQLRSGLPDPPLSLARGTYSPETSHWTSNCLVSQMNNNCDINTNEKMNKMNDEVALSLSDSVQRIVQYRPLNEKEGLCLSDRVPIRRWLCMLLRQDETRRCKTKM